MLVGAHQGVSSVDKMTETDVFSGLEIGCPHGQCLDCCKDNEEGDVAEPEVFSSVEGLHCTHPGPTGCSSSTCTGTDSYCRSSDNYCCRWHS